MKMKLKTICLSMIMQLVVTAANAEGVYTHKDSASFFFKLGKDDQADRRYATAWKYYEKAASLDTRSPEIQLAISEVCLRMNRMAPAIKALEVASALRPADYVTQWKLVQLYFNYGQHNKVIEMLPVIHTHMPEINGWAYMLGKSYNSVQNYGKSIEYLNLALKAEPTNAEASYLIARTMVKMTNYKAAIPYYYRTLASDSTSQPHRLYEFALVLATAEQFDASIAYFKKALERGYQARDDFYMNMAYTMADAKKTNEAMTMMKDLLVRRPHDLSLLNGIADICYHSNRFKEAIEYWDAILSMDAKNARALYQIGTAYIKMGKEKDGQQLCDQAINMDPSLAILKRARSMPM